MINVAWMESFYYDAEHEKEEIMQLQSIRGSSTKNTVKYYQSLKGTIIKIFRMLSNIMFMYLILLGVSNFLGIFLHPFFYAFLVSFIIVQSPQMNNLLKALWEPKFAILATIILMFLIVYIFVILSYNSFPNDYPDENCISLWTCFVTSIDQTLKNSGIGNYLNSGYTVKTDGLTIDYERLIYDNIEFLLITLLLIAIISGIIIDKFGELRSRREENDADAKFSCFICGRESKDIDRDLSTPSFEQHVKLQHNLWDYVYFIAFLKHQEEKNPAGFSAFEKYVIDKINDNDPSWFPAYQQ